MNTHQIAKPQILVNSIRTALGLSLCLALVVIAGCQQVGVESKRESPEAGVAAPTTTASADTRSERDRAVTVSNEMEEAAKLDGAPPAADAIAVQAAPQASMRPQAATPQPAVVGGMVANAPKRAAQELVVNTENYDAAERNAIHQTAVDPVSTFAVDVDTGSYTNTRRMLTMENRLPPHDAVRPEEFINYFDYNYPQPKNRENPFSVTTELGAAPWNSDHELLLIGLQGYSLSQSEIPAANLVFLLDVSGSMDEPNKLPLLKASLAELVERLSARDRVAIVVYAGAAGVVLEPTPGNQHEKILAALDQLSAGGSTNGGEGIELAYKLAEASKIEGGVNRILLATDGDFNVGQFDQNALKEFVSKKRATGISLSTFGFGAGNYNDAMAEQLADVGNGKYSYIDSINEAKRVLGRELAGSLYTIASDVKVQIEFNPAVVSEYRLIGYDNRMLAREDFNNDKVDAGDIGAGHRVTALYEITRVGGKAAMDPLRYGTQQASTAGKGSELGFLKLRYKAPGESKSVLVTTAVSAKAQSSYRLNYAASVAAFAEYLRGSKYLGDYNLTKLASDFSSVKEASKSELTSLLLSAQSLEKPEAAVQISSN